LRPSGTPAISKQKSSLCGEVNGDNTKDKLLETYINYRETYTGHYHIAVHKVGTVAQRHGCFLLKKFWREILQMGSL
jgi:hypothetical protein